MKTSLQIITILSVLFLSDGKLFAQQNIYSKVFSDNSGSVQANAVTNTPDNGFIIAGQWNGEAMVMKADSAGTLLWEKQIGESMNESFNCITPTIDSCFVLAGSIYDPGNQNSEIFYLKITAEGDTLWSKSIDPGNWGTVASISQTSDRGFVLCGTVSQNGSPSSKIFITKLSEVGNVTWMKMLSAGNNTNNANSVRQTPDSGFIVMGYLGNLSPFNEQVLLIKLTPQGQVSWSKQYNLPGSDFAFGCDVLVKEDGLYSYFFTIDAGFVLMKTDNSGNLIWSKKYDIYGGMFFATNILPKLHSTSDGNFVFVTPGQLGQMLKVDAEGILLWKKDLFLSPVDVVETRDRGLLVVGNGPIIGVKKTLTTNPQVGIILTDSLGNGTDCIWSNQTTFSGVTIDTSSIDLTWESNYTAHMQHPVVTSGILTSDPGCVAFIGGLREIDPGNESFTIYPNPTRGIFTIKTADVKTPGTKELMVFNALGKLVYSSGQQETGSTIDLSWQPDGIYMVRLMNNNQVISQKLLIQH